MHSNFRSHGSGVGTDSSRQVGLLPAQNGIFMCLFDRMYLISATLDGVFSARTSNNKRLLMNLSGDGYRTRIPYSFFRSVVVSGCPTVER